MKKMDLVAKDLIAPEVYGPKDAELTLLGWGSSKGVIREAVDKLNEIGIKTNQLHIRYIHPFQSAEVQAILGKSKKVFAVECNYTGQFARHLRAETGISVDELILRYDGEPLEPNYIVSHVRALLSGQKLSLDVSEEDAREMAYHYIRTHLPEKYRPGKIQKLDGNGHNEPVWSVEVISRDNGAKFGQLTIGVETGATYSWQQV